MSDFLGIDLVAGLNEEQSREEINKAIGAIQDSSKLKSLELKLEVDEKILNTIKEFNKEIKNLSTLYEKTNSQLKQILPGKEFEKAEQQTQKLKSAVDELSKTADTKSRKNIDSVNQEVKANEKLAQSLDKLKEKYNEANELESYSKTFKDKHGIQARIEDYKVEDGEHVYKGKRETYNRGAELKLVEKENRELKKLATERENLLRHINNTQLKFGGDSKQFTIFKNQVSKADIDRLRTLRVEVDQYKNSLQKLNEIERAKLQAKANIKNLEYLTGGRLSEGQREEVQKYLSTINSLTPGTQNLTHEIQKLHKGFGILKTGIIEADQGMARFSRQMASALVRVPIYAATMAAMYAPMRMFQDAVKQTIELDTQMTVLERVSNGTISMNNALEDSIGIAERLGNTIFEVNEGLIEFARQGFRGDELTAITEVATLASNVSDLSVEDAASSITAAMKGFNIEAEKSIRIVDAMNEVNVNQPPCTVMYM